MIEFFRRIFGQPGSSNAAKERLRLVLMSDHLALAPEMVDKMKADLVEVISRYVKVDLTKIEVNFEQQDTALAMLANIPILSVNRQNEIDSHLDNSDDSSASSGGPPAAPKRRRRKKQRLHVPAEAVPS